MISKVQNSQISALLSSSSLKSRETAYGSSHVYSDGLQQEQHHFHECSIHGRDEHVLSPSLLPDEIAAMKGEQIPNLCDS